MSKTIPFCCQQKSPPEGDLACVNTIRLFDIAKGMCYNIDNKGGLMKIDKLKVANAIMNALAVTTGVFVIVFAYFVYAFVF